MIWIKYNEIQLTKNKMDLNNRIITIHGNSNRKHTAHMLHKHLWNKHCKIYQIGTHPLIKW